MSEAGRPPAGTSLRTNGVSLSFSGKTVLDSVSLSFVPGQFTGIIGPNGSGKTSLLRVLDGIYRPVSGTVELFGRTLASYGHRERARTISFMMQGDSGAVTFPVLDVVLSGRYPYGESSFRDLPEDIEQAREALSRVELSGFENRRFDTLSTGEQQLVLFARILVQDTPIILLDEPTSNLDIMHQERIFSLAGELALEGRTVIASIHTVNEASRRCSRIVLLDRGRAVTDGPPEHVMKPSVLDGPFSVKTVTVDDILSGAKEVRVLPPRRSAAPAPLIHIIGGGGTACALTRSLYAEGFRLSGGPVPEGDADAALWKALAIPFPALRPFSCPGKADLEREAGLIGEADHVVICFPAAGKLLSPILELIPETASVVLLETGSADFEGALDVRSFLERRGVNVEGSVWTEGPVPEAFSR